MGELLLSRLTVQETQRSFVTVSAEADDDADGFVGQIGMMAERFAGVDVGNVYFHKWDVDTADGIADGDTGMGIGAGIDDDEIGFTASLMDTADDIAFAVALETADADA